MADSKKVAEPVRGRPRNPIKAKNVRDAIFAVIVRDLRESLGLSVDAASKAAKLDRGTWYRLERGDGGIKPSSLKAIGKAIGKTADELERLYVDHLSKRPAVGTTIAGLEKAAKKPAAPKKKTTPAKAGKATNGKASAGQGRRNDRKPRRAIRPKLGTGVRK